MALRSRADADLPLKAPLAVRRAHFDSLQARRLAARSENHAPAKRPRVEDEVYVAAKDASAVRAFLCDRFAWRRL